MSKIRTSKYQPISLPTNTTDETGHVYGRLTVLSYSGQSGGKAAWLCRCECGQEPIVRGDRLRTGRTVSCGCWRADPNIRQAARMKLSPKRRREIANLGGSATAAKHQELKKIS